jgi:PLP dependent protein
MSITSEIQQLNRELPGATKLVAVSKFHPVVSIQEAYDAGQRIFGESRVQEFCQKIALLPSDIEWHFIGHLQTNKIKQIVPYVSLIHSVDSIKLLMEINREGENIRRVVPCLLQIHVAQEDTKFGFTTDACKSLLSSGFIQDLKFVRIRGLMCMASLTDDRDRISSEFNAVKCLFDEIKSTYSNTIPMFNELSMGMSDDYKLAIESGSTLVRIGSRIFGQRAYI